MLRVARTIADLNGSEKVRARDVGSALALRSEAEHAGAARHDAATVDAALRRRHGRPHAQQTSLRHDGRL